MAIAHKIHVSGKLHIELVDWQATSMQL